MYRRKSMQGIYHKTGVSMVTQKGLLSFKIKKIQGIKNSR